MHLQPSSLLSALKHDILNERQPIRALIVIVLFVWKKTKEKPNMKVVKHLQGYELWGNETYSKVPFKDVVWGEETYVEQACVSQQGFIYNNDMHLPTQI